MSVSKRKMMAIVVLISIPLMVFSIVLNTMSHRRMLAESYVHASNLNTIGIVRKLDYAIGFGKPLEKFYGMDILLKNAADLSEYIEAIEIRDKEGNRVDGIGEMKERPRQSSEGEEYVIEESGIYSFVDFEAGQIVLRLNSDEMSKQMSQYIFSTIQISLILFGMILLSLLIIGLFHKESTISVRQLKVTSIVLLLTAQFILGGYTTVVAVNEYKESVRMISQSAAGVIQSDINEVLNKGMEFAEIKELDEYLDNMCEDIPELSNIKLVEGNEAPDVYEIQLIDEKNPTIAVQATTNAEIVRNKIMNHVIDIGIIIMVTLFVSLEVIGFITGHLEQRKKRKEGELYFPGFRLFVFISGIAFSLDCGFVSIMSTQLYERMNLPDNMTFLSGLPNTLFSLAIVLGLFGCSFLISKLGTKKTLFLGVAMGVIGYILCAMSTSLAVFAVARFVFGFCDGLVINTIRLYASSQKELHNKILVTYFAAMNLGVCCSVVIGGLVADVTSYNTVFVLGAILGIACLFLIGYSGFSNAKDGDKLSFVGAVRQLRHGKVFIFMLFVVVPIYIATLFVEYTFPLFGDEIGFSNSLISACLMINYLIIAYLTDPISGWVNKRFKPQKSIVAYVFLQAFSIGLFVVFANPWVAILALILTSLMDGFGMVVIDSVLDDVKGVKTEESTLLQMIFGKAGMVLGPMIVTANLSQGAAKATGSVVVILVAGIVVYLILRKFLSLKEERR